MAYFTDPMGDEFKKAIEEAMRELENDDPETKRPKKIAKSENRSRKKPKNQVNRYSRRPRKSLK